MLRNVIAVIIGIIAGLAAYMGAFILLAGLSGTPVMGVEDFFAFIGGQFRRGPSGQLLRCPGRSPTRIITSHAAGDDRRKRPDRCRPAGFDICAWGFYIAGPAPSWPGCFPGPAPSWGRLVGGIHRAETARGSRPPNSCLCRDRKRGIEWEPSLTLIRRSIHEQKTIAP